MSARRIGWCLCAAGLAALLVVSCDLLSPGAIDGRMAAVSRDNPADGDWWEEVGTFAGATRGWPMSFVVGDAAYYGLGTDWNGTDAEVLDVWRFDASRETWSRVADFPGHGRRDACGIGLDGKGYVFLGRTWSANGDIRHWDSWRYDPTADSWTAFTDNTPWLTEEPTDYGFAVAIGAYGYVILGHGNPGGGESFNLWRFDPVDESLELIGVVQPDRVLIGGSGFNPMARFAIGTVIYVLIQGDPSGLYLFSVDVQSLATRTVAIGTLGASASDLSSSEEFSAEASFEARGRGFFFPSLWGSDLPGLLWGYSPASDRLVSMRPTPFARNARLSSFVLGDTAYVVDRGSNTNLVYRYHPAPEVVP